MEVQPGVQVALWTQEWGLTVVSSNMRKPDFTIIVCKRCKKILKPTTNGANSVCYTMLILFDPEETANVL